MGDEWAIGGRYFHPWANPPILPLPLLPPPGRGALSWPFGSKSLTPREVQYSLNEAWGGTAHNYDLVFF